jgi:hypothetical protein
MTLPQGGGSMTLGQVLTEDLEPLLILLIHSCEPLG